jgi:hypothetical protein
VYILFYRDSGLRANADSKIRWSENYPKKGHIGDLLASKILPPRITMGHPEVSLLNFPIGGGAARKGSPQEVFPVH